MANSGYRYGFQSQETDNELWGGAIWYLHRVEDTRIGRFFSTDPLEDDYPHNSPYAFSENRVLDGIELEGAEWQPIYGNNDSKHAKPPIDYKWVGYNPDGKPVAGSVESGFIKGSSFSFYFSSYAPSKTGSISINSNTQLPTEHGWARNNITAFNYLINITQTYKYPSSYKITASLFSSTIGLYGSQLLDYDKTVSPIDPTKDGLLVPSTTKRNPTGTVLLSNAAKVLGVGGLPRTSIDSDGLGPFDYVLGGGFKFKGLISNLAKKSPAKFFTNFSRNNNGFTLFQWKQGKDFRIDFDTKNFLHYHRRGKINPITNRTFDGQGIGRHRPWQSKSTDKSFFDRF